MPTLVQFGAFDIVMRFNEHNPPHVLVVETDFKVSVRISDAKEIKGGKIPPQHRREALAWIKEHREELERKWDEIH
jgi:hypothetical protein